MGTVATIQVVGRRGASHENEEVRDAVARAVAWFNRIEETCTRFDDSSELMQLVSRAGSPVQVSDILFETVQFALAVAGESDGAFDPTIGHLMETSGFDEEYRSGNKVR